MTRWLAIGALAGVALDRVREQPLDALGWAGLGLSVVGACAYAWVDRVHRQRQRELEQLHERLIKAAERLES